uniref:Proteasome activator PA28 C-terminal domain-containing protein n=1 Tax=Cairina moschata TaxID=8855 RepID=A0A8C3BTC8_CAIMO
MGQLWVPGVVMGPYGAVMGPRGWLWVAMGHLWVPVGYFRPLWVIGSHIPYMVMGLGAGGVAKGVCVCHVTDHVTLPAPPCPPIPSHPALLALLERWRPLLAEARNHVAQVALWLQLQVPRIEDGDNFGVAVQEKVLELLTASRTQLEGLQGRLPKYLSERGDAVSKAAKNPHVLDYRALVHALDAAELGATRLALAELRDLYAVLLDVLQKNMEKLRKPRGEPKAMIF